MNRKQQIELLAGLPTLQITYETAVQQFGGQVEAAMDTLNQSSAKAAKGMPREDFKYWLAYKRASDPEGITDAKLFARLLATNSECWLKIVGRNFIDYQPIHITPDKIMATYEQRARSICAQRLAQRKQVTEDMRNDAGPEDDTDLEGEPLPLNGSLRAVLSQWLQAHPSHDKRLASVAFVVLEQLIQSGE